jgi:hypothetical protein
VAHDLPAVLHAQLVHDWHIGLGARRFTADQHGDEIAAAVHHLAPISEGADLQSQDSKTGLGARKGNLARLKAQNAS